MFNKNVLATYLSTSMNFMKKLFLPILAGFYLAYTAIDAMASETLILSCKRVKECSAPYLAWKENKQVSCKKGDGYLGMFEIILDNRLVIFNDLKFPPIAVEGRSSSVSPSNILWSMYTDDVDSFITYNLDRISGELVFTNYAGHKISPLVSESHLICEKTTKEDFAKSIKQKF